MANKRTLIVDDEPDIRELLEITLGRMKLETVAAADLASAIELVTPGDSMPNILTSPDTP